MSNCHDIEANLLEIVEHSLAGKLPDEISDHLAGCPACRELVETYQPLLAQLNQKDQTDLPDSVWRSVQQRINEYEERKRPFLSPLLRWHKAIGLSLRSLSLAAAVAVGIYLGSGFGNGSDALAEEIVAEYSSLLGDLPSGSLSESYFELDWENGGENR